MESIRLGGPAHGIVTKTVHKTLPGCGGGSRGWVGGWLGGVVGWSQGWLGQAVVKGSGVQRWVGVVEVQGVGGYQWWGPGVDG